MIVPSIGTSIVAFKLICARLQLHASGASKPRLASSASAGNSGCSLGKASSLMTSLSSGEPGGNYVLKPGRRTDLTPIVLAELVFLMLSCAGCGIWESSMRGQIR